MIKKKEKCKIQSKKTKIEYLAETENSLEAVPRPSCFHTELETLPRQRGPSPGRLRFQSFHNGRHTISPPSTIPAIADYSTNNTSREQEKGCPSRCKAWIISQEPCPNCSHMWLPTSNFQLALGKVSSPSQIPRKYFLSPAFIVLCRFSSVGDTHL